MKKTKFIIKNETNFNITDIFYEGECIENKVNRILINKEPITDGAPLIYTKRQDGVLPGYDIRTDRFEVAIEAMDKVSKSKLTKRMEYINKDSLPKEKPDAQKPDVQTTGNENVSGDPSQ
ncbi:MAG: hypothetical protein GX638_03105 [Crenarchaeota archaeon]|nr:hypothetical protein [Thermoproteota archaeon]